MDPFAVAATSAFLISAITELVSQIMVVSDLEQARDLESATTELQSLANCLECLRNNYGNRRIPYPDNISKSLLDVLQNCESVTNKIQALVNQISPIDVSKQPQWSTRERVQMNALICSLEAHKSAIEIALQITPV